MRLGCGGCLILALLIMVGALAGGAWVLSRALAAPGLPVQEPTAADGHRAQQKIYDLARRGHGRRPGRADVVTLSEAELNAFFARHLGDARDLALDRIAIRLPGDGLIEVSGSAPVRDLTLDSPLSIVTRAAPRGWLGTSVWLHARGRLRLEPGGRGRQYLRLDVERLALGQLPVPMMLARLLFDPAAFTHLRLQVPEAIEAVTPERGRLVIRAAS
jgi:hypothetical protein